MTAIWWIRRDLRLIDNPALHAALAGGGRVVPLFVLDPALLGSDWVAPQRVAFLVAGLRLLAADLQKRGSGLLVRLGKPELVVPQVVSEVRATAVYAQADISPYARQRDKRVAEAVQLNLVPGLTVHPPDWVLKADSTPYTVFTPFSKAWKSHALPNANDLLPVPDRIATPDLPPSDAMPETEALKAPFPPGETEAQHRLAVFVEGSDAPIFRYGVDRNQLDLDGTSQLSPYLRLGMISARQAVVAALQARDRATTAAAQKGVETWLNELIWREFYAAILYHFPHVRRGNFRPQYDTIPWRNDGTEFAAWCAGKTGYPVVDAAMRQLLATGWMHNRARMIVASFLVKDLLIDWRWGEKWFMQHLVDGDPAANNGGWQWTAGTGTDAAPYFRIFNPMTQGAKFDPDGAYIRRWLPELANVPDKYIHEPYKMPLPAQKKAGCIIGKDYPAPIVDHGQARQRTMDAYKVSS
ncbi:MAG: deoxyribodipyrimidine photo-lyase [Ardenticatenaceae bacterium]|nr:deoxyribodipyrimidine photo-lyase [Ardenticatenaceae bacterium]MCB9445436.1 deoxyribodipyrimidine photo-lyase [Ardenticatenaceae bacterium]